MWGQIKGTERNLTYLSMSYQQFHLSIFFTILQLNKLKIKKLYI